MNIKSNTQLKLAFEFVENTGENIFLTGKAGTGKTTFLHSIKSKSFKRSIVVAPTGVAAINAGGVTIHSFFQLPFGPQPPNSNSNNVSESYQKFNKKKIDIIRSLDLLIIDEISMVRADLLDSIDRVLRRYKNRHVPFGGVQLLMIGDLQQLAPVVKDDEWKLLKEHYITPFFFSSNALQQTKYISIELQHIYRQDDKRFIELLGKIRENNLDENTVKALNKRFIPGFSNTNKQEGYITLTTHNYQSNQINQKRLNSLNGKYYNYKAVVEGEFPENIYPTEYDLLLKIGAQVMFVKNDLSQDKLFYNGKIGIVEHIEDDVVYVKSKEDNFPIAVSPLTWENTRYTLNDATKEIKEKVIGTFTQYPLKLAWAITIHKSQGLTFEKAIVDAEEAFAHGQVYVALSRCKSMEGLVLNSKISGKSIKGDSSVKMFTNKIKENTPDSDTLYKYRLKYHYDLICELFDFTILHKQIRYFIKLLRENQSTIDKGLPEKFFNLESLFEKEIVAVAKNFLKEIDRHVREYNEVEKNMQLQDRIKKGCGYFISKINSNIESVLNKTSIETDNKQVEKKLNDFIKQIFHQLNIKKACLDSCKEGFLANSYIEARAKASIESVSKTKKSKKAEVSESSNHPELLKQLKQWRDKIAEDENIPLYMILPRKSMISITNELPGSLKALVSIFGFGKKKAEKFGEDIIKIVNEYCRQNELTPMMEPLKPEKSDKNTGKRKGEKSSKQVSCDLFKAGFSVDDIAKERNLAKSTVSGHLSYFVGTGDISVENLVSKDKIELITEYFTSVDDYRLGPAKEVLGDNVTFDELRFVFKHLEGKGVIKHNM